MKKHLLKLVIIGKHLWIVLFSFLLFSLGTFAQNLVPNHNFDSVTTCPSARGQLDFAPPWYSPNFETSDLMHECSTSNRTSIPDNFWGSQYPASGRGMAGIRAYLDRITARKSDYKEYIAVELTDSLKAGEDYFLSFKVTPGENNRYITDDVGLLLTDTFPRDIQLLNRKPVLENRNNWLLSNSASWFEIKGNYKAKGGEKHLIIGNFKDDANTTLALPLNPKDDVPESAYLFIDDVVVEPCSSRLPDSLISYQDAFICNGESITLNTPLRTNDNYLWSDGSTTPTIVVDKAGIYSIEANINGCTMTDSVEVTTLEIESLTDQDITICQGETLVLWANEDAQNSWSDGSTSDSLAVTLPGVYVLTSEKNNCKITDSVTVNFEQLPDANITDTLACDGALLTLELKYENASYLWDLGDTTKNLEVFESGIYTAAISTRCFNFNKRFFVDFVPCSCGFFAPNAFSPNNDGVNEQFEILVDNAVEPLQLTIINRWGELVYQGANTAIWETEERASLPESGTYFWEFSYRCFEEGQPQLRQQNGYVQVMK